MATARELNLKWRVGAKHALYRKTGDWYHRLRRFPGVLFDDNGYVMFNSGKQFLSSPFLRIKSRVHILGRLHQVPGYVRVRGSTRGQAPGKESDGSRVHKVTRISYNSAGWRQPTGDARKYESAKTFNHINGFGHEDWLFRSDWLIDGWRYAFVQGVSKSRKDLLNSRVAFDLTLFTIEPNKRRRYVADLFAVEPLSHQQATEAIAEFRRRGWLKTMQREIKAVQGNANALGAAPWADHALNIRYRWENVKFFPEDTYASDDDPIRRLTRLRLFDRSLVNPPRLQKGRRRFSGSTNLPVPRSFMRRPGRQMECTPEHARMQKQLMLELQKEFPKAEIRREVDFVDVSVRTPQELILFEIKSDLEPRTVIRQALGQILEYAFYPLKSYDISPRLVIVGRARLASADQAYVKVLQEKFSLPLSYRVVNG